MSFRNDCLLSEKDLDFIKKSGEYNSRVIEHLTKTKDSTTPHDSLDHRRAQEVMRDKYGYVSTQLTWNGSNKVIHNFDFNDEFK